MRDLIIIGGGPAGLAAAVFAVRKRLDFLIVSPELGGKTNMNIHIPDMEPNIAVMGRDQANVLRSRIQYYPDCHRKTRVARVGELDEGFSVHGENGSTEIARTIIVASGCRPRPLGVPGEARFFGRGIGSSAVSYSHAFWGKTVFVWGDSARAVEAATDMAQGAARVVFASPVDWSPSVRRRIAGFTNIEALFPVRVGRFNGDSVARNVVLQRAGGDGAPVEVAADGFFVEHDPVPMTRFLPETVIRNSQGRIVVNKNSESSVAGIYAAGDVTDLAAEQITVALGDGTRAAMSAYSVLSSSAAIRPAKA